MAFDLNDKELKATRDSNGTNICVGDYVRTKNGDIVKVIEYRDELVFDKEIKFHGIYRAYLNEDEIGFIVKHSKNIIDLIEVGDFVNGYYIHEIGKIGKDKFLWIEADLLCDQIDPDEIKSIVTKESFKNAEYRVETN